MRYKPKSNSQEQQINKVDCDLSDLEANKKPDWRAVLTVMQLIKDKTLMVLFCSNSAVLITITYINTENSYPVAKGMIRHWM